MSIGNDFKQKYTLEKRKSVSSRLLKSYPDRIPVIVFAGKNAPEIDRRKYIVPRETTVAQFTAEVRKHINIKQHQSLFLFFNNSVLAFSSTMGQMYEKYKDEDGFLYVTYTLENVFG